MKHDPRQDMGAPRIADTIFHDEPNVAYGFLGYCDGRLGYPANPPKQLASTYMREYLIGKRLHDAQPA